MQATPQQMSGGVKYSSSVHVGNWYEEKRLHEEILHDFRAKSQTGRLALRKQSEKIDVYMAHVPHSYHSDGRIRFGDYVVIHHESTDTSLACDPQDTTNGSDRFLVTSTWGTPVVARTVYKIEKVTDMNPRTATGRNFALSLPNGLEVEDDGCVHYGQRLRLVCNEAMRVPSEYISSTGGGVSRRIFELLICI